MESKYTYEELERMVDALDTNPDCSDEERAQARELLHIIKSGERMLELIRTTRLPIDDQEV